MSNEIAKGKSKQINGKIREGVGKLTHNRRQQVKGRIERFEGRVQVGIGKVKRKSKW